MGNRHEILKLTQKVFVHSMIFGLALWVAPRATASAPYTFTQLDFPGAANTQANGINDSGQIVGGYFDLSGTIHGFLLSGGAYTPIDHPGATSGTQAFGISGNGQIVGQYYTCTVPNGYGCRHSFLLSGSVFTSLPDAPGSMPGTTAAFSINNNGQIVGYFVDSCFCTIHGFIYSSGVYSAVDQPGFSATALDGINDSEELSGSSAACWGCGTDSGFTLQSGTFTNIGVPNTASTTNLAVSNRGDIAGSYFTSEYHGFFFSGGTFTYLDYPGAQQTTIEGQSVNSAQQVVGSYSNPDGSGHGFLASPAYDVCLLYDATKAVKSGATIPIKFQLCDGAGVNQSSPSIGLHVVSVTQTSLSISGAVQDAGNADPDSDFRYDAALAGYIFNLKTTGLTTGTYSLNFQVGGIGAYAATFQVK